MKVAHCYSQLMRQDIDKAVAALLQRNAPMIYNKDGTYGCSPIRDFFISFIQPSLIRSIEKVESFIPYDAYPNSTKNGATLELGSVGNVRFFINPLVDEDYIGEDKVIIQAWDSDFVFFDSQTIQFKRVENGESIRRDKQFDPGTCKGSGKLQKTHPQ